MGKLVTESLWIVRKLEAERSRHTMIYDKDRIKLCDSCRAEAEAMQLPNLCISCYKAIASEVEKAQKAGKSYSATIVILSSLLSMTVGGLAVAHIVNYYWVVEENLR